MNDGRFIYDITGLKNHSFALGTLSALPTDWAKLGNNDDGSTFVKSNAVSGLTLTTPPQQDLFVGLLSMGGTDTQVYATQAANPSAVLNKEYVWLVWLRTVAGTGSGSIGIAGVDGGGTVHDAEVTTSFTGNLSTSAWTLVEVKATFTDPSTTNARLRIYQDDATNGLYVDHTLFGRLIDLQPGGGEPAKLIKGYEDNVKSNNTISKNEEVYELIKLQDAERTVRLRLDNVFNTMAIHDKIIEMVEQFLANAEPIVFFFDKSVPGTRHFLLADNIDGVFSYEDGVARKNMRVRLDALPWKGYR